MKRPRSPPIRCCRSSRRSRGPLASWWRRATSLLPVGSSPTFRSSLTADRRQPDDLAELGELAKTPQANIIKLPNISASIPQLQGCDQGAAAAGLRRPRLPGGSADRRGRSRSRRSTPRCSAARSIRCCAKATRIAASRRRSSSTPATHPHSMGAWSKDSKSHVAHMAGGDFYAQRAVGRHHGRPASSGSSSSDAHGTTTVLKDGVAVDRRRRHRRVDDEPARAHRVLRASRSRTRRPKGVLLSLHLKATMMKVSDPIMFGHAVRRTTRTSSTSTRRRSRRSASIRTTASATSTRRFRRCPPISERPSRPTFRPSTRRGRRWRWSTRARGSPTFTCRAT